PGHGDGRAGAAARGAGPGAIGPCNGREGVPRAAVLRERARAIAPLRAGFRTAARGTKTPVRGLPVGGWPAAAITPYIRQGDLPATMKQTWRQHAACRGLDPLIFYPVTEEEAEHAKDVCAECPVREACL